MAELADRVFRLENLPCAYGRGHSASCYGDPDLDKVEEYCAPCQVRHALDLAITKKPWWGAEDDKDSATGEPLIRRESFTMEEIEEACSSFGSIGKELFTRLHPCLRSQKPRSQKPSEPRSDSQLPLPLDQQRSASTEDVRDPEVEARLITERLWERYRDETADHSPGRCFARFSKIVGAEISRLLRGAGSTEAEWSYLLVTLDCGHARLTGGDPGEVRCPAHPEARPKVSRRLDDQVPGTLRPSPLLRNSPLLFLSGEAAMVNSLRLSAPPNQSALTGLDILTTTGTLTTKEVFSHELQNH